MGKYKIMVTYVEAGMGHIISADAIADALETYYPDEVEVERCHILRDSNDPCLVRHEKFLVNSVKRSNKHPWQMKALMVSEKICPHSSMPFLYGVLFHRVLRHCSRVMLEADPDMVFSTHFTPLYCAIRSRDKGNYLAGVYVPDPNVHEVWHYRSDLLLVNNPRAYREAMGLGFREDRTVLSTFVLRNKVKDTPKDKRALRRKYGLPEDHFTVTMAAGAYAEAHLKEFCDRFLKIDRTFSLVIIAGKNEEVYRYFEEKIGKTGNVFLKVCHFEPDAHELYGASDVFVTKAGPNAILDSVYMDTPVITNYYASPIERITKDLYVTEHGCGLHIEAPEQLANVLQGFMDDPETLKPYIENCRAFIKDHTGGEKQMADSIMETLRRNGPPKADRKAAPAESAE